jgi:hypothetical protein
VKSGPALSGRAWLSADGTEQGEQVRLLEDSSEFVCVCHGELRVQVGEVKTDGALGDEEAAGDLGVAQAAEQQCEDVLLPVG